MVMCAYFSAPDDEAALGVLDQPGGPHGSAFDTQPLKGFDPVVVMVNLEALLTDCAYDEAAARPRSGQVLSSPEDREAFVVSVSDTLQEALVTTPRASLADVATRWSAADELRGLDVTPGTALEALTLLAELADRARSAEHRLFCWWAL
ncbi:hypothetical protein ASR50_13045 [Streptomyces sp. 4F]|nr:hypothetical protein ASR50_13045 [Streptomyces sp. 4F]